MKIIAIGMMSLMLTFTVTADETAVERLIKDAVSVKSTLADTSVTGKVFNGKFYNSKIKIESGDSNGSKSTSVVIDGKAKFLWQTTTNREMKTLFSCLKDGFKLNSKENINIFEKALNEIFPKDKFSKSKIIEGKGKIIFVRGKFFKKYKGFIATIDKDGTITAIDYKLGIEN